MSQTSPDVASGVYFSELDLQDLLQTPEPSKPSNEQSPQQLLRWCIAFAKGEARSESTSEMSCTSKPNDHTQPGILTSLSIAPELPPPIRNPIQTPRMHTQSPNAASSKVWQVVPRHPHACVEGKEGDGKKYVRTCNELHVGSRVLHVDLQGAYMCVGGRGGGGKGEGRGVHVISRVIHVDVNSYMFVCVCVCVCAFACEHMCVCVCVCVCVWVGGGVGGCVGVGVGGGVGGMGRGVGYVGS